jgi:nicotinate-nucleotide adenylyltransferase
MNPTRKRIGIFGGSFNPVHRGHTGLALGVCRAGFVDEVWLMVSPLNPWKQHAGPELAPTADRLAMARLAAQEGEARLQVSDFETRMPVPSYSVDTLLALREAYPDADFRLIMGEDNWERFAQWRSHEVIRASFPIIVYGRHDGGRLEMHSPDGQTERADVPFQFFDVSGTQLREALRTDAGSALLREQLNPDVLRYIQAHGLYGVGQ